ncbi:TatA/E family twin arginine-targeting protein translocase [soil metagenome]
MYLFILESIGTSELILIGIIALVLLGPRKLPEIARKAGKIMSEFRGTAAEFKETWQREVNFEEEAKALSLDSLDDEPVARSRKPDALPAMESPAIREVDPSAFDGLVPEEPAAAPSDELPPEKDKKSWL